MINISILAAAIPIIANAAGAALNAITGRNQQKRQNEINAAEAEKEREFNREQFEKNKELSLQMWNMENKYNTPAQQIERLRAAGINPQTEFGNMNIAATAPNIQDSSQFVPERQKAIGGLTDFQNLLSGIQIQPGIDPTEELKKQLLEEEIKNKAADTEQKIAGQPRTAAEAAIAEKRAAKWDEEYERKKKAEEAGIKATEARTTQIKQQAEQANAREARDVISQALRDRYTQTQINTMQAGLAIRARQLGLQELASAIQNQNVNLRNTILIKQAQQLQNSLNDYDTYENKSIRELKGVIELQHAIEERDFLGSYSHKLERGTTNFLRSIGGTAVGTLLGRLFK